MKEFRKRVLIPLAIPLAAALVIVIAVLNVSMILVALEDRASETLATVVAILAATGVLIGAAYLSAQGQDGSAKSAMALVSAGLVLVLGGVVGAKAIEEGRETGPVEPVLGAPDIVVTAGPGLVFQEKQLTTTPGEVVVEYVNIDTAAHTLRIDDVAGFKLEVSSKGDVDKGAAVLEPGTYTYFCDIPGHRQAGMEGALTVTDAPA